MLIGLLKTIFFLLTFYYLFKLIGRLVLPYIMKKGFEKMQQQQQSGSGSFQQQARQEEGKVTIKKNSAKKSAAASGYNEGEYVDFEEVK